VKGSEEFLVISCQFLVTQNPKLKTQNSAKRGAEEFLVISCQFLVTQNPKLKTQNSAKRGAEEFLVISCQFLVTQNPKLKTQNSAERGAGSRKRGAGRVKVCVHHSISCHDGIPKTMKRRQNER
jgi:hypothetical protein